VDDRVSLSTLSSLKLLVEARANLVPSDFKKRAEELDPRYRLLLFKAPHPLGKIINQAGRGLNLHLKKSNTGSLSTAGATSPGYFCVCMHACFGW
jgi:hypothetical protein